MKLYKKIILGVTVSVVSLAAIACGTIYGVWHDEINTICSVKLLSDSDKENQEGKVYEMTVSGGFYFDEFLKTGAKNDSDLINYIVNHITKGVIPVKMTPPTIGCSAFTAVQEDNGHHLFGRNYDMSETSAVIVKTNPGNGRHASVSTADLRYIGLGDGNMSSLIKKVTSLAACYTPLDGINDAGVSCGIFMSYQGVKDDTGKKKVVATDQNTEKVDLTSTTMLRMVLDYASSVDEAVKLVEQYDLHDSASTSFHYMIADKSGASAILEWMNGTSDTDNDGSKRTLKVYRNTDSYGEKSSEEKFQWVTNFLVTPDYYALDSEKAGFDRYQAIHKAINADGSNNEGKMSYQGALDVLKMVGRRNWGKNHEQSKTSVTPWSALYDLDSLSVTWVGNENFDDEKKIFHYSLKK